MAQSSEALGFQEREREKEKNFFKKRTPTLAVSTWSDLTSLKQFKRSLPFNWSTKNKIHSPSPYEEPSLK